MNPSTSLGTRSKVGMAKPSPPVRQAGNIGHLLVIRGVYRRSLPSACAHVKYRCRCRVIHNLFVMPFTFIRWAQVIDFARMDATNNEILDRVCFFSRVANSAGGSPPQALRDRRLNRGESADARSVADGES